MLGFTMLLLCVVGVLGLVFAGGRRRVKPRLYVVPNTEPKKKFRPRLRVWRGKLDRKNLYYDPKRFRRPR